jgi:hypothetical protein
MKKNCFRTFSIFIIIGFILQTTRRNDGFRRFKIFICITEAKAKVSASRKVNSLNIKQDTVNLIQNLMFQLSPIKI